MPKKTKPPVDAPEIPNLSHALGVWAKRHNVTPIRFSKAMQWSYPYAWRVLRGLDPFVPAGYGPFLLVFGLDALQDLFKIAGVEVKGVK